MSYVKLDNELYYGLHPSIVKPDFYVDYYVDLTESTEFPTWVCNGSIVLNFPIRDRKIPNSEQLADIIALNNIKHKTFYIFCKGGHGRSGTVAAILYGLKYNMNTNSTLKFILKEWITQRDMNKISDKLKKIGSPQTNKQKQLIKTILH